MKAELRDTIIRELGFDKGELSSASSTQRFAYERQIDAALDSRVKQMMVAKMTEASVLRETSHSTYQPAPNTSQLTAVGGLSNSDLSRMGLSA
jgi:hypothetical protein